MRGQVLHEPWVLHDVEELDYVESLNDEFGVKDYVYSDSFYSPGFDVYFKPFKEVGTISVWMLPTAYFILWSSVFYFIAIKFLIILTN